MKGARQAILNAAMRLFAEKGYAASSIREICQTAGVTKPVLYYHFLSKTQLYQELMLDIFSQAHKNLLRVANRHGSLRERLIGYVYSEFRSCKKDRARVRFVFRMMFSSEGEYPYSNYLEEFTRQREVIADSFRQEIGSEDDGFDPPFLANALLGMLLVGILGNVLTRKPALTRRTAEKIVDLLLPPFPPVEKTLPIGIEKKEVRI